MGKGLVDRVWATLLSMLIALSLVLGAPASALAADSGASSAASLEAQGANVYDAASGASLYVDTVLGTGHGKDGEFPLEYVPKFGNLSAGLGFPDKNSTKKYVGENWPIFLAMDSAKNAVTYSYDADKGGLATKAVAAYGRFGYLLSVMGYDQTGIEGIPDSMRKIQGSALHLLYYASSAAHNVMQWSIRALKFTNVFALILEPDEMNQGDMFGIFSPTSAPTSEWVNGETSTKYEGGEVEGTEYGESKEVFAGDSTGESSAGNGLFASASNGSEGEGGNPLASIIKGYRDVYKVMKNMAITVLLPLGLAFAIFMYVMAKASFAKNQGLERFKKWGVRLVFVIIGIPMFGSLYTTFLNRADAMFDEARGGRTYAYNASQLMLETFVDFKGWVNNSNLSVNGMKFAIDKDGRPTDETYARFRDNAATINFIAAGTSGPIQPVDDSAESSIWDYTSNVEDSGLREDVSVNGDNMTNFGDVLSYSGTDSTARVNRLFDSYSNGEFVSASEYARALVVDVASSNGDDSDGYAKVSEYLVAASDPQNYAESLTTLVDTKADNDGDFKTLKVLGTGDNLARINASFDDADMETLLDEIANGDESKDEEILKKIRKRRKENDEARAEDTGTEDKLTLSDNKFFGNGTLDCKLEDASEGFEYTSGGIGLPGIGMYNYLRTSFSSNGFTVYSEKSSTNTESRVAHYATNLAGGGIIGVLNMVNAGTLMLACAMTGILYGVMMLISNVKRSFKLIISAPMAFSGAMKSIATVLLLAAAMGVEIIGSVLAYELATSFLSIFNKGSMAFFAGALPDLFGGSSTVVAQPLATAAPVAAGGAMAGGALVVAGLILSTLFHLIYIVFALRLRVAITGAIDDGIASIIKRITGASPAETSSSSGMGLVRGAITGGAMVAAGGTGAAVSGMGAMAAGGAAGTAIANSFGGAGGAASALGGATSDGGDGVDVGIGSGATGGVDALSQSYASMQGMENSRDVSDLAYESNTSVGLAKEAGSWETSASGGDSSAYGAGGSGTGGVGVGGAGGLGAGGAAGESGTAGAAGLGGAGAAGYGYGGTGGSALSQAIGQGIGGASSAFGGAGGQGGDATASADDGMGSDYAELVGAGSVGAMTPDVVVGTGSDAMSFGNAQAFASSGSSTSLSDSVSQASADGARDMGHDGAFDRDFAAASGKDGSSGELRMAMAQNPVGANGDLSAAISAVGYGQGGAGADGVGYGYGQGGAGADGHGGKGITDTYGNAVGTGTLGNAVADARSGDSSLSANSDASAMARGGSQDANAFATSQAGNANAFANNGFGTIAPQAQNPSYMSANDDHDRDIAFEAKDRPADSVIAEGGRGGEGASAEARGADVRGVEAAHQSAVMPAGADVVDVNGGNAVAYGSNAFAPGGISESVAAATARERMASVQANSAYIGSGNAASSRAERMAAISGANVNVNGTPGSAGAAGVSGAAGQGGFSGAAGAGGAAGLGGAVGAAGRGGAGGIAGAGGSAGMDGIAGAGGAGGGIEGGRHRVRAGSTGSPVSVSGSTGAGSGGIYGRRDAATGGARGAGGLGGAAGAAGRGGAAGRPGLGGAAGAGGARGLHDAVDSAGGQSSFQERLRAYESGPGAPTHGVSSPDGAGGGITSTARPAAQRGDNNTLADARAAAERRKRYEEQRNANIRRG